MKAIVACDTNQTKTAKLLANLPGTLLRMKAFKSSHFNHKQEIWSQVYRALTAIHQPLGCFPVSDSEMTKFQTLARG